MISYQDPAEKKTICTINVPDYIIAAIDYLLENGRYESRSQIARIAITQQMDDDEALLNRVLTEVLGL